jgi:hypothetical protein
MKSKRKTERAITARPLGLRFAVRPRGRQERPLWRRPADKDAPDSNTVDMAPGCYRRLPGIEEES